MDSIIKMIGSISFPQFSSTRIMMMPFLINDLDSLPDDINGWRNTVAALTNVAAIKSGTAYLTIDETTVSAGETHRRPGLHVDGVGGWGGGGGGWGKNGMLVASNKIGCRGWNKNFAGEPGFDGDCEELRSQCRDEEAIVMLENTIYYCSGFAVHESIPVVTTTQRQFIRLSMPNDCPWYEGYTVNPTGIKPTGPILPARINQMNFRTS